MQVILFEIALDVGVHIGLLTDKGPAAQLLGPDNTGAAGLVVGRRKADEPVIVERLKIQIAGAGVGQKAQFYRAGFQPAGNVIIGTLIDLHIYAGECRAEARHDLRQPCHAGRVEHSQPQRTLVHTVDLCNGLLQRFAACQHLLDRGHQVLGGSGQCDAAFCAGEKRKAALGLHTGDGMAHGGGGNVQPFGCGGKGTQLRHDTQQLAVGQGHDHISCGEFDSCFV